VPSAEAEKGMADGTRSVPATFHAVNGYNATHLTALHIRHLSTGRWRPGRDDYFA